MKTKTTAEFWTDFAKDLIGYEKGYLSTLKGVYLTPEDVFESYFNERGKYLSPFALLGVSFSIYYLISGFLVDWELVSATLKTIYRAYIEWVTNSSSDSEEIRSARIEKLYREFIIPTMDYLTLAISKYLIVIVIPMQVIFLYATSLFTKKTGYDFFHLFVSFNYFFSFTLLFVNLLIVISLVSIWLTVPFLVVFNYFFYGHFFKSFGDKKVQVRTAFLKGTGVAFIFIILVGASIGVVWGLILNG